MLYCYCVIIVPESSLNRCMNRIKVFFFFSEEPFVDTYKVTILFLGVVHLGSPWTGGQCFVHHCTRTS